MGHHRNAPAGQEMDRLGHMLAAFQLDRRRAGFTDQPRGVAEGLFAPLLIGAEGHVDDQHRLGQPAGDRLPVQHHHVHRGLKRCRMAVKHHRHRIADQGDVAMRVDQPGHRRRVGRQHDQRVRPLAGLNIGRRNPLFDPGRAHFGVPLAHI